MRPWYRAAIEADSPTWTEIYPFFSVPVRLGLTAVRPLRDEGGRTVGVLGCDLVLTHISQFLKDMDVGKSGKTYIMERDGSLVASSKRTEPPPRTTHGPPSPAATPREARTPPLAIARTALRGVAASARGGDDDDDDGDDGDDCTF